jgi:uncharacterized RDD family membrane protein YckC
MSAPSPPSGQSLWGHYAGSVSRLVAFVVDLALSIVVYELALAAISYIAQIVTGSHVNLHSGGVVVLVIFILWEFVYFGGAWASSGRTPGMALLGICVVRTDGTVLDRGQGWLRAVTFPLGFLTLGIGFLWILVDRERRGVYDLIAGTTVVYAWDARAGRMKFLSRPAQLGPGASLPPAPGASPPPAPQLTDMSGTESSSPAG